MGNICQKINIFVKNAIQNVQNVLKHNQTVLNVKIPLNSYLMEVVFLNVHKDTQINIQNNARNVKIHAYIALMTQHFALLVLMDIF